MAFHRHILAGEGMGRQKPALQVATGRALAVDLHIDMSAAKLDEPLSLYYGSWGVQKDNQTLIDILDAFLCKSQEDGTLADLYTKWMAPEAPEFPAC